MRSEGYTSCVVERYIAPIKQRKDFLGFIDILCLRPAEKGMVGIQSTSGSNFNSRLKKALALETLDLFVNNGNIFEVHGWAKRGPRGKRKTWQCRRLKIDEDNLRQIRCAEMATDTTTSTELETNPETTSVQD
tara:strand:+ start:1359 stop:1757 length:399 start_codon:yes stop_codon:yes gene_type:complete